jgi:predicted RNase H-like nuclease (RuvC/YqgF family)
MLAGMLIGVAVFYFLVMPEIKQDYQEKLREMETSYNQTISTKNNEIENLKLEKDSLSTKNSEYQDSQVTMQTTIDNLASEVETLKRTVENGGMTIPSSVTTDTASVTNATQVTVTEVNQAAQRNNENVIGISGTSIEDIISNE